MHTLVSTHLSRPHRFESETGISFWHAFYTNVIVLFRLHITSLLTTLSCTLPSSPSVLQVSPWSLPVRILWLVGTSGTTYYLIQLKQKDSSLVPDNRSWNLINLTAFQSSILLFLSSQSLDYAAWIWIALCHLITMLPALSEYVTYM